MAGSGEVIVNYLPENTSPTNDDKVMLIRDSDGELTNVPLEDIKAFITQGSSGIFWVTYNITTYSEIRIADVSGKLPVLRMNVVSSNTYTTSEFYLTRLTNSSAVFTADQPSAPGIRPMVIVCDSNNVWSMDYSKYDSDYVAYDSSKSYSAGTVGLKLTELGGAVPSPYSSNPADVGAAFVGSSNTFARGDHAHDLSSDLKAAILQLASKVAYIDDQGQTYYQDLYDALYPGATYAVTNTLTGCTTSNSAVAVPENSPYSATITPSSGYSLTGATVSVTMGGVNITSTAYNAGVITIAAVTGNISISVAAVLSQLSSISAVYTQSGTVYTDDSLDSLKTDLVVTATWSDTSTTVIPSADYTLSGTLAEGTQTISVLYGGDTATFTVTCTVRGWLYHFTQNLVSSGSKDFGFQWSEFAQGGGHYDTGYDGTGYACQHYVATEGETTTDQGSIYANGYTAPDLSGDFTISLWEKSVTDRFGQLLCPFTVGTTSGSATALNNVANVASGWSVSRVTVNKTVEGIRIWFHESNSVMKLQIRLINTALSKGSAYEITLPASINTTSWHHYALTRKDGTIRFFFDGAVIFTLSCTENLLFATQVALGEYFNQAGDTTPTQQGRGNSFDDLFVAEYCKWDAAFDPTTITY